MIERYSLPEMNAIWQEEFKFKTMLDIEILALEALAKKKLVPFAAVKRIAKKARFNIAKIKKIEEKTQHDVVAFVANVAQYIGADAKYLHMGLTSSDVLDTTLEHIHPARKLHDVAVEAVLARHKHLVERLPAHPHRHQHSRFV